VDLKAAATRLLLASTVPLFLLILGGLGKHLITTEFRWGNFFLGPDFALTGIGAGLLNFLDMLDGRDVTSLVWKIIYTVCYLTLTFGIYMLLLVLHQNIEKRQVASDAAYDASAHKPPIRPEAGVKLGMFANFVGLGPAFVFTLFKLNGSI
jgi:hypothetical protein